MGLQNLVKMILNLDQQASHREGTGRVNHAVRTILDARGPSSKLGTRAKVFYVAQIDVKPPTIAMVVNKPALFEGTYERYFRNQLREHLPFSEVPIKLVFSERKREDRTGEGWAANKPGGKRSSKPAGKPGAKAGKTGKAGKSAKPGKSDRSGKGGKPTKAGKPSKAGKKR
jgi:hypothetical protein